MSNSLNEPRSSERRLSAVLLSQLDAEMNNPHRQHNRMEHIYDREQPQPQPTSPLSPAARGEDTKAKAKKEPPQHHSTKPPVHTNSPQQAKDGNYTASEPPPTSSSFTKKNKKKHRSNSKSGGGGGQRTSSEQAELHSSPNSFVSPQEATGGLVGIGNDVDDELEEAADEEMCLPKFSKEQQQQQTHSSSIASPASFSQGGAVLSPEDSMRCLAGESTDLRQRDAEQAQLGATAEEGDEGNIWPAGASIPLLRRTTVTPKELSSLGNLLASASGSMNGIGPRKNDDDERPIPLSTHNNPPIASTSLNASRRTSNTATEITLATTATATTTYYYCQEESAEIPLFKSHVHIRNPFQTSTVVDEGGKIGCTAPQPHPGCRSSLILTTRTLYFGQDLGEDVMVGPVNETRPPPTYADSIPSLKVGQATSFVCSYKFELLDQIRIRSPSHSALQHEDDAEEHFPVVIRSSNSKQKKKIGTKSCGGDSRDSHIAILELFHKSGDNSGVGNTTTNTLYDYDIEQLHEQYKQPDLLLEIKCRDEEHLSRLKKAFARCTEKAIVM